MTHFDFTLSDKVAYGFASAPEWRTQVVPMDSGVTQRDGKRRWPLTRLQCDFTNVSPEIGAGLNAALYVGKGQLHAFRVKDWNDYLATDPYGYYAPTLNPAIGSTTPAQLLKVYSIPGVSGTATDRRIQALRPGVVVKRDGVAVAGTLDERTGLFTPAANWVTGVYTWEGEHDVWCRFESDYSPLSIGRPNAKTLTITLIEEPLR